MARRMRWEVRVEREIKREDRAARKSRRLGSVGPGEERGPVVDLFGPIDPNVKAPRVLPPSDEWPF